MSRLFSHFTNLLPGTDVSPQSQVASAIYVTGVASQDDVDVSEFNASWWDSLADETKAGFLCMIGAAVLKEAFKHFKPEEAVVASVRAITSLPPEDQRDLNA